MPSAIEAMQTAIGVAKDVPLLWIIFLVVVFFSQEGTASPSVQMLLLFGRFGLKLEAWPIAVVEWMRTTSPFRMAGQQGASFPPPLPAAAKVITPSARAVRMAFRIGSRSGWCFWKPKERFIMSTRSGLVIWRPSLSRMCSTEKRLMA